MNRTLQQQLDFAFRSIRKAKAPNPPNEEVLERERAFRDQAARIEKLRQERLSSGILVYEVVQHRGHWRVLHQEKHSKPFDDQEAAIEAARGMAADKAKDGHPTQVILRRPDGEALTYALVDAKQ